MGCSGSSSGKPQVDAGRRRLSVGQADGGSTGNESADVKEDMRGEITKLSDESIMELLAADTGGRKFSIGSGQDTGKTSFADKALKKEGDEVEVTGLGFTCRKGLKPESPNQDSWMILRAPGSTDGATNVTSIYGVFDGHGSKGHDISFFVKDNLPKLLFKDSKMQEAPGEALTNSFKKIQALIGTADQMKKLDAKLAGTTATVAIHNHQEKKLTLAHVADSTAVLAKWADASKAKLQAVQLTRDHKPDLKDERARIEKAGGRVVFDGYANHRIYAKNARYPGLNMSRCLGDLMAHQDCGVSCEPEIKEHSITELDEVLMLCSDGVWEFIQPEQACEIIQPFGPSKAKDAADKLAKEAWDRWIKEEGGAVVDDITVVLIYLNQSTN